MSAAEPVSAGLPRDAVDGPPSTLAGPPRGSVVRDWLLIAVMVILAHPVVVVVMPGLIVAAVLTGEPGLLGAPVVCTVFGLGGAFVRRGQLPGRAVRPVDEPDLAALVRRVAERLDFAAPLMVRVVPTPEAGLMPARLAGMRGFALVLGWPLLRRFTAAQLTAVVAHEIAHHQSVADRRVRLRYRAREALVASRTNLIRVPDAVAAPLLRATQAGVWRDEGLADARAAHLAGPVALRGALEQVTLSVAWFDVELDDLMSALVADGRYPRDLYEAMDAALAEPRVVRRLTTLTTILEGADPLGTASHPPLAARLAALPRPAVPGPAKPEWEASARKAPGPAGVGGDGCENGDDRAADRPVPLRDAAELERWCGHELLVAGTEGDRRARARRERLRPARILDTPPERFDPPAEKVLAALMRATGRDAGPAAIDAAVEALAAGRWLPIARAIEPGVRRLPEAAQATLGREVVAGCLGRVIAADLRAAGWERAGRWTASVVVGPDGVTVDVFHLVAQAADSGDAGPLRALLSTGPSRAAR